MKRILDNLGTACWLGMDICWMKQYNTAAIIFMFLAIFLLVSTVPKSNVNEILGWVATTSWLYMNSAWMVNDILTNKMEFLEWVKNMFMISGSISVIAILIFDTHRITKIRRFK